MTHSLLIIIPLSFHPTQAPLFGYLMEVAVWGRGSGHYKACVCMLWLAGGIHLICCDYYRVRPHTPPPHSARPDSIHTQCAVSVPERISALHREERINTTTQLICIHVPREPHENPGLHLFCIKPATPITEAPLDLLSLLWEDFKKGFCFFLLLFDSFKWFPASFHSLNEQFVCLWCLHLIGTMLLDVDLLWASRSFPSIFGLVHWVCFFVWFWETAALACRLKSPTMFTRKRSPWCKRPSERPIRRIFWRQLWGWGWGHRNLQPLSGSHLNYSPIHSSPHWSAEPHWRRATEHQNLRKSTTSRWDSNQL